MSKGFFDEKKKKNILLISFVITMILFLLLSLYRTFLKPLNFPQSTLTSLPKTMPEDISTGPFVNNLTLGDISISTYEAEAKSIGNMLVFETDGYTKNIVSPANLSTNVPTIILEAVGDDYNINMDNSQLSVVLTDSGYFYNRAASYGVLDITRGMKHYYALYYTLQSKILLVQITEKGSTSSLREMKELLDLQAASFVYTPQSVFDTPAADAGSEQADKLELVDPTLGDGAEVDPSSQSVKATRDAAAHDTENSSTVSDDTVSGNSRIDYEYPDKRYDEYRAIFERPDIAVEGFKPNDPGQIIDDPDVSKYPMALTKEMVEAMTTEQLAEYIQKWRNYGPNDDGKEYFFPVKDFDTMLVDFEYTLAGGNPGNIYICDGTGKKKYFPDNRVKKKLGHSYFLIPNVTKGTDWYVHYSSSGIDGGKVYLSEAGDNY